MKHLKLFENFINESGGFANYKYATCLQTDAIAAIGVLNQQDRKKIQDSYNQHVFLQNIDNDLYGTQYDYLKLVDIDISNASYILYRRKEGNRDENEFIALPPGTDPYDYEMFVDEDGETHFSDESSKPYHGGVFELVRDKMIVHNLYSYAMAEEGHLKKEVMSVSEFMNTYFKKDPRSDYQIYSDAIKPSVGSLEGQRLLNMKFIEQHKKLLKDNEDRYRKGLIDRNYYEDIKRTTGNRMALYQKELERVLHKYN